VVEELLPASISMVAEVDVDERVVPGPDGLTNKLHAGMLWSSAAFFYVALGAGAHYIFPDRFAAHTPGDDVVER